MASKVLRLQADSDAAETGKLRPLATSASLDFIGTEMRVVQNPEDIGKCGCGRRVYCDGSHALTEAQWQEVQNKEREAALADTPAEAVVVDDGA